MLRWVATNRGGQSVEGFAPGPGDGFLAAQVVRYGAVWAAFVHRRRLEGAWPTAEAAQAAAGHHLARLEGHEVTDPPGGAEA